MCILRVRPGVRRLVGTTELSIVSHSSSTLRSGGTRVSALSFLDKRRVGRGKEPSRSTINLSSRLYSGTTNFVSSALYDCASGIRMEVGEEYLFLFQFKLYDS